MEKTCKIIKLETDMLQLSRKGLEDRLQMIKNEGFERIGIDLKEQPSLNSMAIGILAYNYVVLHDLGAELFLVNPSMRVMKVLESTGLVRVIKIEYT
jgi:anti-anti-sigma factor